ncbi:MAG: PEP-CTERM sorting domain-containing protein [Rhodocyclaceae bacterium]
MTAKHALLAAALALAGAHAAHAAAPTYQGHLSSGSFAGTVAAESGPWTDGANWSLWTFSADLVAEVSITVTPTNADLDPYIAVWYGTESDTANYLDMSSDGWSSLFIAGADGLNPWSADGAGEPAALSFTNTYGSGPFVLAIADYADGLGSGQLAYTIAASVPEPETYAMFLAGLGLSAALRLRRRT